MCIHVIFYDDRRFTDPGDGDPPGDQQPDNSVYPKFDVFYAWSDVEQLDFTENNERLYAQLDPPHPPDPPALDFSLDLCEYFEAGEYIGITSSSFGVGRREVWTSFSGTLPARDPDPDQVVIWSSLIEW